MQTKNQKVSTKFDEFTGLYELQKTLRFELKPTTETKSLIKSVQKDKEIDNLYNNEMKPLFDALHEKFITESLQKVVFSTNDLKQICKYIEELKKLKQDLKGLNKNKDKNKKAIKLLADKINDLNNEKSGKIPTLQNKLRANIAREFNNLAENWKNKYNGVETGLIGKKEKKIKIGLKSKGIDILKEENILALLAEFNKEKINIIQKFNRFFTYFSGFNKNRENYYSSEQKATAIANRIININLDIFIKNNNDFNLFSEKLSKIEKYRKYFEFENFKNCLTQDGIENYNDKVGDVKSIVNLEYNQKPENKKSQLRGLKKLQKQIGCDTKQQREQIKKGKSDCPEYLEKVGLGYQITKDSNDKYQIWECLNYVNKLLEPKIEALRKNYENFFGNWQTYNINEIWFKKEAINTISARWFGGVNWFTLGNALAYCGVGKIKKETGEYKVPSFISLQDVKEAMEVLEQGVDVDIKKLKKHKKSNSLAQERLDSNKQKENSYKPENLFKNEYKNIYKGKSLFEAFLAVWQYEIKHKLEETVDGYTDENKKHITSFVKNFEAESVEPFDITKDSHKKIVFDIMQKGYLPLLQISKYHDLRKRGEIAPGYAVESKFYEALEGFWEDNPVNLYRTAFQSTLTKKPYSEDKIKLNFDNASLLKGWDINKEGERKSVIFRKLKVEKNELGEKEYDYYLAIIEKGDENIFDKNKNPLLYQKCNGGWEKMEYNFFPSASKMIPKCSTQLNSVIKHFQKADEDFIFSIGHKVASNEEFTEACKISKEIFELNNKVYKKGNISVSKMRDKLSKGEQGEYIKKFQKEYLELSKNEKEYKLALKKWIDFCVSFLSKYPKTRSFEYSFRKTENYKSVDEFYKDVDRFSYMKKFVPINYKELENLTKTGKIYLLQIYNKDFSTRKNQNRIGKDSLETIVIKSLFSKKNLDEKIIKLNGEAELFYRDKSIKKQKDKERSSKTFDIFKNKRYTEEKYFFHFPVTINFGAGNAKQKDFNKKINYLLQNQETQNIIGIDRGEKNLLYYSVISLGKKGNVKIEEQGSLNRIETKQNMDEKKLVCKYDKNGKLSEVELVKIGKKVNYVDYHLLLDYYEKKRILARKSWQTIGKIKDLKDGYLSQVIYELYKLIVKYNAVVVMENLNVEFKAKRMAMVEKSVYKKFELALAKKLNHLILKDKNPSEIGGALKPYQLTPKIEAGGISSFEKANQWGILFYVQPYYTSTTDPLTGWRKHKYISNSATVEGIKKFFDAKKGEVKIDFDKNKKSFKFSYENEGKNWELFAHNGLQRFYWNREKKKMEIHNLYDRFKKLFENFDKSKNINQQLYENGFREWKNLVFLWNLLNQIRNTNRDKEGDENDFLQSAVWSDEYNKFFDSRKKFNEAMPSNGDANGAYNIARKGLILFEKIQKNPEKPDLSVSNKEWDEFVQV